MRIIGILFYTAVIFIIGIAMIIFAIVFSFTKMQPLCIQYINDLLINLQESLSYRLAIMLSGFLLILIGIFFAQLIMGRFQREKTIAFNTGFGEVTISLSAVEDLIRRLVGVIPEVKELRPDVVATKKGIFVDLRVILKSETNIPELTSRLQEITRSKIQEVLGVEEQITIRIHVAKIISFEEKKKKEDIEKEQPPIPFRGYDRV